jgi:hypothetical protein
MRWASAAAVEAALIGAALAAFIVLAGSCSALNAYDDVSAGTTTGGQGTGGATGGTAGAGNVGGGGAGAGATGGGGSTAGGGGAGAQGGAGGGPCDPRDVDACPGQKCTVVDEATGTTGCATAGPVGAWSVCVTDADCAATTWCDHPTHVCKPVCQGAGDCHDPGTQCLPAQAESPGTIPGLLLCVANCNPMSPVCGLHTNCIYLTDPPLFDCAASLDHADGDNCTEDQDCAAGMTCAGGTCRLWCDTPGDQFSWCKSMVWCCALDPAPSYGGTELGYCACP